MADKEEEAEAGGHCVHHNDDVANLGYYNERWCSKCGAFFNGTIWKLPYDLEAEVKALKPLAANLRDAAGWLVTGLRSPMWEVGSGELEEGLLQDAEAAIAAYDSALNPQGEQANPSEEER